LSRGLADMAEVVTICFCRGRLLNAVTECTLKEFAQRIEAWSCIACHPLLEQLYLVVIDGIESCEEDVARVLARTIINRMGA